MVGAVVVHEGKIIGEGYHPYFGGPHAEVNALRSIADQSLLPNSTLFVNLEPCCHHGKTPPCTDLILRSKIKKVVIATRDPFPMVNGKGIEMLRRAGCTVITGVLREEGEWLNRRFFTFHKKKRPYVILKWAQSADGYFAKDARKQYWITGEISQRLVHRWRSEEDAIMVGTNTVRADNPRLTNRLWVKGKQPVRIILDRHLRLPARLRVFDSSAATMVFTEKKTKDKRNIRYVHSDFNEILPVTMSTLYDSEILSVMVEGGARLLQDFIRQNLWDEARIFTGDVFFNGGIPAPVIKGKIISEEAVGKDKLRIMIPD